MSEQPGSDPGDSPGLGERPGANQNPLGPSFNDGPHRTPTSMKGALLGLIPAAVIAAAVAVWLLR